MNITLIARVVQEGRFVKAYDVKTGQDLSKDIPQPLRIRARNTGCNIAFVDNTNWELIPIESEQSEPTTEPVMNLMTSTETDEVIDFVHNRAGGLRPKDFIISDVKWKYLVRSVMRGRNVMMLGETGTGKSSAFRYVAEALGRPMYYFNLGATQDPRSTLIGNVHFAKESGTYFSEALFVKAIQTENSVILLDELSRAHPDAWNILMTVLDPGQRYLRLDENPTSPTIKVANGVCFMATANVGNQYTSTRKMDRAIEDRFIIIEMDQLTADAELKLLKLKFPNAKENELKSIAEIAAITRNDYKSDSPRLTNCISTRAAIETASLISDGFSLAEAAEVSIYPFFSKDGGVDSERTYIKQIVQKYCVVETHHNPLFESSDAQTK